jgi:FkbM family methyltransferase
MRSFPDRIRAFVSMARWLWDAGVSLGTIACFPLRRRFHKPEARIQLRSGILIAAPTEEPLLSIFREIWVDRVYGDANAGGRTVIDIGANVGVFTLFVASRSSRSRVIAVEPAPRAYGYLCSNLRHNKLGNVIPLQVACGGSSGKAILYSRHNEAMNCLYAAGDRYGSAFHPVCEVEVLTLDQLFVRFQVKDCRLLKLDCEGAEYEILYAASSRTLASIDEIVMEYHVGISPASAGRAFGIPRVTRFPGRLWSDAGRRRRLPSRLASSVNDLTNSPLDPEEENYTIEGTGAVHSHPGGGSATLQHSIASFVNTA